MKINNVLLMVLCCFAANAAFGMAVVNNLVHRKLVNLQVINRAERDYVIAFSKKKDALEMAPEVSPSDVSFSENVPAGGMKNINLYFDFDKWVAGLKKLHVYVIYKPDTVYEKETHWIKGLRFALHVSLAANNNCTLEGCCINTNVAGDAGELKERAIDLDFNSIISNTQQLTLDQYQLCLILDGDALEKSSCFIEPYKPYQNMMEQGMLYCFKMLSALGIPSYKEDDYK